jgi:hypothetical protein
MAPFAENCVSALDADEAGKETTAHPRRDGERRFKTELIRRCGCWAAPTGVLMHSHAVIDSGHFNRLRKFLGIKSELAATSEA